MILKFSFTRAQMIPGEGVRKFLWKKRVVWKWYIKGKTKMCKGFSDFILLQIVSELFWRTCWTIFMGKHNCIVYSIKVLWKNRFKQSKISWTFDIFFNIPMRHRGLWPRSLSLLAVSSSSWPVIGWGTGGGITQWPSGWTNPCTLGEILTILMKQYVNRRCEN